MSGIVGLSDLYGQPVEEGPLPRMLDAHSYRGPDGHRALARDQVGLGHPRRRRRA